MASEIFYQIVALSSFKAIKYNVIKVIFKKIILDELYCKFLVHYRNSFDIYFDMGNNASCNSYDHFENKIVSR